MICGLPPELLGGFHKWPNADFFLLGEGLVESEGLRGSGEKDVHSLQTAGYLGIRQNMGRHIAQDAGGQWELDQAQDTVVARDDARVRKQRMQTRSGAVWIKEDEHFAALPQPGTNHGRFALVEVRFRCGKDQGGGVGRYRIGG